MRLKDSSGKPSTTLTLVALGLLVLIAITIKQWETINVQDFGTAWMLILGPWIAREVKGAVENHYNG